MSRPSLLLHRRAFIAGSAAAGSVAVSSRGIAAASPWEPMARAFVAAVNDRAARGGFVSAWMSEAARKRRPADEWNADFEKVLQVSGGLDYVGVRQGPREQLVTVRARRQARERDVIAIPDRHTPDKLWAVMTIAHPTAYDAALLDRPASRAELREAIDQRLRFAVERDEFRGALRVCAPDGTAVYEAGFGRADGASGPAITPDSRLHLGSADKSFTALMIGRHFDAGRLKPDTTLAEVLPRWPNRKAAEAITIRHLLTHSAGLGDLWSRPGYDKTAPYTRVTELLPYFWEADPAFAPGTSSAYSNEGFVVLGAVLEAVGEGTWYDQLDRQVYRPAGMLRSGHFNGADAFEGKVVGYRYGEDDVLGLTARRSNRDFAGFRGNSCGGGYSTVRDMTGYLRALHAGALLPRARADAMSARAEGGLRGYGMGFQNAAVGGRTVRGHGGGGSNSGIDGDSWVVWETGWTCSILGAYDAPFTQAISEDLKVMLAAQA